MANARGMGSVSWGQRKALRGIPYGTDPAYLLAQQQMQEEYNLMPERSRLAEEKRRADMAQAEADKNRTASGKAGLVSTGGNILAMDALSGFKGTQGLYGMGAEGVNYLMGNTSMPYAVGQQIANTGGTIATGTGVGTGVSTGTGTGLSGTGAVAPAIGDAGSLTGVTAESLEGTSITGSGAGMGLTGVGGAVLPAAGAGLVAGQLGASGTGKDIGRAMMFNRGGGKENASVAGGVGGAAGGALAGAAATSWSGPGAIVGAVIGGVLGAATSLFEEDGGCIIVTACTDRNSPEVELTREYRDKFLTPDQLRGYYMIAETILPYVKKHKTFVKRILVDNLIEYGRYALDKTSDKPSLKSRIITRTFLFLCKSIGRTRKQFIRANGEVF